MRGVQRKTLPALFFFKSVFQAPSAQNNQETKVASFGVTYSATFQSFVESMTWGLLGCLFKNNPKELLDSFHNYCRLK